MDTLKVFISGTMRDLKRERDKVLLSAIAVQEITDPYRNRFRKYLRLLGLNIGLMANFHSTSLEIETLRV